MADNMGGKGHQSENSNTAVSSCWQSDQHTLTMSLKSTIYPMAVRCFCFGDDSSCACPRLWLPNHIFPKLSILAMLCNVVCSATSYISTSFWDCTASNTGSLPAKQLYWVKQSVIQQLFCKDSCHWCLTAPSWSHLNQEKYFPQLWHNVVR